MRGNRGDRRRAVMLIAGIVMAAFVLLYMAGAFGGRSRHVTARRLDCLANQQVTPFGDRVLYYDNKTLHCLSAGGAELWSYDLGEGAGFDAGPTHVAAWAGSSLYIIDRNGRSTYNDNQRGEIQFARCSAHYVAVVSGDAATASLTLKDLSGMSIDTYDGAKDGVILDVGFFENDRYYWVTGMDPEAVTPGVLLHLYESANGKDPTNTGNLDLSGDVIYRVLYSGKTLYAVSTREVKMYDYRAQPKRTNERKLVYGWQLADANVGSGDARMLFVPIGQTEGELKIIELRVLEGNRDRRYTLPNTCIGAGLMGGKIFAFANKNLYVADLNAQSFVPMDLKNVIDGDVTRYIGMLSGRVALVAAGDNVYAVTMP